MMDHIRNQFFNFKMMAKVGIVLKGLNDMLIEESLNFNFKMSNSQTEYEVIIAGLMLAKEIDTNK